MTCVIAATQMLSVDGKRRHEPRPPPGTSSLRSSSAAGRGWRIFSFADAGDSGGGVHGVAARVVAGMSEELRDLRCKIPALVDCFLEAEARATGGDKCAVVRAVLIDWAKSRHTAFIQADKLLRAEGLIGESQGRQRAAQGNGGLKWD